MLPAELILMICDYLDTEELKKLSLVNSYHNDIVNRRIWVHYQIHASDLPIDPAAVEGVLRERCDALLRIPSRTRHLRKLSIGPCHWSWSPDVIQRLNSLWVHLTSLSELTFHTPLSVTPNDRPPIPVLYNPTRGGDFDPVLRSLILHGKEISLRVFKYESWLLPDSLLLEFLRSQASIKTLIGVDVFPENMPSVISDSGFLPGLGRLVCDGLHLARYLLPGRPIQALHMNKQLTRDGHLVMLEAIRRTSVPVKELSIASANESECNWVLKRLGEGVPTLSFLDIRTRGH
jgi:hypothetical protein